MGKFWASSAIEPKRQHRWLLYIFGQGSSADSTIPAWAVKKVAKPKVEINETEHKFFGHSFWYPGHVTWQDMTVTIVDPVDPDTGKTLMTALRNSGYVVPTERNGDSPFTVSKENAVNALNKQLVLVQIGPDSQKEIEKWRIKNPWIKSINFGDLDYESDGMVEIELTFRYDFAVREI